MKADADHCAKTKLSYESYSHTVSNGASTTIIGERINPTDRGRFQEDLKSGNLEIIKREAILQKEAGAHILDVNVGTPGVDEVFLLPKAVLLAAESTNLPVCIDSSDPLALEAALEVYPGKALINSVNGTKESLTKILPLAKRYKAAVIGLTLDDNGIPTTQGGKFSIAQRIVESAESIGVPRADIIIDCLVLSVATHAGAVRETLYALESISAELGVNTTLGASNISFGMPRRAVINAAFLAMAINAGLSSVITDPTNELMLELIMASDVLARRDINGMKFIKYHRAQNKGLVKSKE